MSELAGGGNGSWEEILRRSRRAFSEWEALTVAERVARIHPLSTEILRRKNEIADLVCEENGKPRVEALVHEVAICLANLDYLESVAVRVLAPKKQGLKWTPNRRTTLHRRPHGAVLVISPWNVPLAIPFGAVLSSLIAGNSVILKPSEITPRVGMLLEELFEVCALPTHLLQVVPGDGMVGAALVEARPDKVVFTGSVATGRKVMAAAARHPIPVTLELGGVDAMIVRQDANIDLATSAACWGVTFNSGQACASVERLLVHESIAEEFCVRLKEKLDEVGRSGELGRITLPAQRGIYDRQLVDARERGLEFLLGGEYRDEEHLVPTLIRGEGIEDSRIYREESFGPMVALVPYATDAEAIALHNDTPFGLTASVFSRDRTRSRQMAERLRSGLVSINEVAATLYGHPEIPWGGVGESGFGRSHGEAGLLDGTWIQVIDESRVHGFEPKRPWWYPYDGAQLDFAEHFTDSLGADSFGERVRGLVRAGRSMVTLARRKPRL